MCTERTAVRIIESLRSLRFGRSVSRVSGLPVLAESIERSKSGSIEDFQLESFKRYCGGEVTGPLLVEAFHRNLCPTDSGGLPLKVGSLTEWRLSGSG